MTSLNKVMLVGRLGRDPEERIFDKGGRIVNFSLATSDRYIDRMGERQERTEWHQVVIRFNKLADQAMQLLRKGMLVYVEGEIRYREYVPKEGGDRRRVTEIFCQRFIIMEPKRELGSDDFQEEGTQDTSATSGKGSAMPSDKGAANADLKGPDEGDHVVDGEEDLPF